MFRFINKKMLRQVAFLFAVLFSVAIIGNGTLIYRSQYRIYSDACRDEIMKLAKYTRSELFEYRTLPWLLDYWEEHASEINADLPTNEELSEWRASHNLLSKRESKWARQEDIEALSEEEQRIYAEYCYAKLQIDLDRLFNTYWPGSLVCTVPIGEDKGLVMIRGRISEENDERYLDYLRIPEKERTPYDEYMKPALGRVIEYNGPNHEVYQKTLETGKDQPGADHYQLFGADYMSVYVPVVIDGKVRAVVSASHTVETVKHVFTEKVRQVEIANFLMHVVIGILLLVQIYMIAIQPLRHVRESLHQYTQTTNSAMAISELENVKTQNEVGDVARDIIGLANTMDGYIDDIVTMTGDRERLEAELNVAGRIQEGLLPRNFPRHEDISIYASMTPAREVGGDLYDFFRIGEDRMGLVIADVSGKGVPGSFFMAIAKTLIRNNMKLGTLSPGGVLEVVNDHLCEDNPEMMFVTAWIGVLDKKGRITCANAGHEFPIIRRGDGRYEIYEDHHDLPLGVMEGGSYEEYVLELSPDDGIFVYTDGLPEAMNPRGEQFGVERILEVLNRDPLAKPAVLLSQMDEAVARFVGDAEQFDDLTMLSVMGRRKE